jgi:effector-binding domain-containing protein
LEDKAEDPLGFQQPDPNLYRYVWNDPVNHVDPSGMELNKSLQELAKKLPGWFLALDKDEGGQVGLFDWKDKYEIEDFVSEEILRIIDGVQTKKPYQE